MQDSGSGVCQLGRIFVDTFLNSTWGNHQQAAEEMLVGTIQARMNVPILFRHGGDSYILFSVEKLKYVVDG